MENGTGAPVKPKNSEPNGFGVLFTLFQLGAQDKFVGKIVNVFLQKLRVEVGVL